MPDLDTIYECTPRQATGFVEDCLFAGLVPFLRSSPGMGKSSIFRKVARRNRLMMVDNRLSTASPEDMTGLPGFKDGNAIFHPFREMFPLEDQEIPAGHDGWLVFFDEANSAPRSVQAASYKVVLDRMIGQRHLHPNVAMGMAGNLETDGAITNPLSTAMQSRLVHIRMRVDFQEWLDDVALAEEYDHRLVAYLSWKPGALMDFRADHSNSTFCCPRTWEFMNALIKGKEIPDSKIPLYAGTITSGVAVDFVQYTKVYDSIPDILVIANNPTSTLVPGDSATRYAMVSSLAERANKDTIGPVCIYVNRFPIENRILFYRLLIAKHPELHGHPEYIKAQVELSRYLNQGAKVAA